MLIYLPLFLQHVGHLSPLYAGFAVLPLTVPLLVVPPLAARMARILTPRRCLLLGPVLIALGLFSMAFFFEGRALAGVALSVDRRRGRRRTY